MPIQATVPAARVYSYYEPEIQSSSLPNQLIA
jgi:hypothetical protein